MAGLALVLMEVVSDFGTVEFFAIETITLGIFNVWLGMNNLWRRHKYRCWLLFYFGALGVRNLCKVPPAIPQQQS